MSQHVDFATTDFKTHIVNNIIKPNYIVEIQDSTDNRMRWKKRGMRLETCSKLFIGLGGIISFSSGFYNYPTLSFISGAISTISLVLLQYANFSYKESKKATSDLNILLDNIGIKKVPELNTATQDGNEMLNKQIQKSSSSPTPVLGSGYTVKSKQEDNNEYINPLAYDQTEEYKLRIKYEQHCSAKEYDEILKMKQDLNYPLTELVLQQTANHKNLEYFIIFISLTIPVNCYDTLFSVAKAGLEFTKLYFTHYPNWNFKLKKNQPSPLLGAIISNDVENVKFVYEHCKDAWMIESCEELRQAYKNKNTDIINFCLLNKAATHDEKGEYTVI
jgi:hypothetical protein